jgi:hypothetical protein
VNADEETPRRRARPLFVAAVAVALIATVGALTERAAREKRRRLTRVLMQRSLAQMRGGIAEFRAHRHRNPQTLREIVITRYLPAIPDDPVTGAKDWRLIVEESVRMDEFRRGAQPLRAVGGIVDVRSAAPGRDADGKAWSEY